MPGASHDRDFPLSPQNQFSGPPRRPPLGPPPSSRRGPSSYYSQVANVHPIVEETDSNRGSIRNPSMHSFASSNAIPIGIPDYYLDNRDSSGMSLPPMTPGSEYPPEESPIEATPPLRPDALRTRKQDDQRRQDLQRPEYPSSPPQREYSPDAMPVRQASLGKRSKPTLTTVKSGDKLRTKNGGVTPDQGLSGLPSQQKRDVVSNSSREIPMIFQTSRDQPSEKNLEAGTFDPPANNAPLAREASREHNSPGSFLDSSSESDKSVKKGIKKIPSKELLGAAVPQLKQQRYRERSPLAPREDEDDDDDALRKEVLGGLEKGGAIPANQRDTLKPPAAGLSAGRVGKPRPARLNVDAVRDAEARGSLTSLPDLIKRATKLASNLDRGRTASRLGMSEWLAGSNGEIQEKGNVRKSAGSLSDILHSFPQPGENGDRRSHTMTWSSNQRHSALPSDSDAGDRKGKKDGRRCCGMPLWLFLVLLVFLVCLVAAAIIVPVVLVVVPKQNDSGSTTESTTARQMSMCANKDLNCANGGQVVTATGGGDCRCLCVNGFTGSTCSKPSQAGCTTMSLGSMTSDATVGDSIPRVVDGAASNFSIPLDTQTLLGLFSSFDLSCSSENALVTFQGKSQRRAVKDLPTPASLFARTPQATSDSPNAAVTSNGIVFESGSASASFSSPSQASATSSPSPSSTPSSDRTSQTNLDFARTAVLYILQSSSQLSSATTAQGNLQSFFSTGSTSAGQPIRAANISLGNGWTLDMERHYVVSSNGTQVGGVSGGN